MPAEEGGQCFGAPQKSPSKGWLEGSTPETAFRTASSARKARMAVVRVKTESEGWSIPGLIDFELEIAVVVLADGNGKHLIDDGQQVVERTHRLQRRRIGRTNDAPGGGEDECILDGD